MLEALWQTRPEAATCEHQTLIEHFMQLCYCSRFNIDLDQNKVA